MALKATVYKADLQISNMDSQYYQSHSLTLALHPSETEQRMMIRLLAFARHATDDLKFGKGLSNEEDASLWQRDLTDHVRLWIDVGLPDEKRIRKACHRADKVIVYAYGERTAPIWWQQNQRKMSTFPNLEVFLLDANSCEQLTQLCKRTMHLYFSVLDGQMTLGSDDLSLELSIEQLK